MRKLTGPIVFVVSLLASGLLWVQLRLLDEPFSVSGGLPMGLDFVTDINRDYAAAMNYNAIDRFLVKVLWWHFGFTVLMAFTNSYLRLSQHFPSPFSWRLLSGQEALVAVLIGFIAAAFPTLVRGRLDNHYAWRVIISVAFIVYSYLFVFMSGGSIEMHFHFFMVLALVTVYSDWRLGWIILVLTAAHHGILNYVAPHWVYFYGRNDLSVIAHGLPVAATAIFTSIICYNQRHSVAILEATQQRLERGIQDRNMARMEAERANQAKNEFLSRMSHELRTPLNAILGFGQLLEMDHLPPEHQESVKYILKAGRHLLMLVDEVLDIARIEAGRLAMSPEPVRMNEALQEALDLVAPMAAAQNVRFNSDPGRTCHWHVLADRQRLQQVFLNLLSNAVKYNHEGGLVTLSCEQTASGQLRIKVTDTGPGIPPDKVERLFTPFDRLGAEGTEVQGSGLGLSLSRHLIEAMGGTLGVDSIPGQGSTFWVELPIVESPVERVENGGEHAPAPAEPDTARKARVILYIEDNLSNLRLIQHLLIHRPEVTVLPAMQGRMGLQLAREHRPNLILLDLHLPDIPGSEVLRRLRELPETREIPVAVISADVTPSQIDHLRAAGAWQYLTKPLDVKKFLALLDEVLTDREAGHAGSNV